MAAMRPVFSIGGAAPNVNLYQASSLPRSPGRGGSLETRGAQPAESNR